MLERTYSWEAYHGLKRRRPYRPITWGTKKREFVCRCESCLAMSSAAGAEARVARYEQEKQMAQRSLQKTRL